MVKFHTFGFPLATKVSSSGTDELRPPASCSSQERNAPRSSIRMVASGLRSSSRWTKNRDPKPVPTTTTGYCRSDESSASMIIRDRAPSLCTQVLDDRAGERGGRGPPDMDGIDE